MQSVTEERGTVLVVVLILAVVLAVFCVTSLMVSDRESQGTHVGIQRDKAFFIASAGLHDAVKTLKDMMAASSLGGAFEPFEALAGTTVVEKCPLMSSGVAAGEYEVVVDSVTAVDSSNRDITITSTGWVPSADHPRVVRRTVTAVLRIGCARSEVFDYVYFINNWAWYHGENIKANGNVRANGRFCFGGHSSEINGLPRFTGLSSCVFGEKVDDGGIYASWDVVEDDEVEGDTSGEEHKHSFVETARMPNLTDLSAYEATAKLNNSSITIGGTKVCNAVVGDEEGEKPNLYLDGSSDSPIVLNGPVVVRGDLIIQGYVTGKGALYAGGNIYVAGDLKYKNKIEDTPDGTRDKMEAWLVKAEDADALGLFAVEHIIVGDYTDSEWQEYVGGRVNDSQYGSGETAGEDKIHRTRAGRDGIAGTADDDALEDDGAWTTDFYTGKHAEWGLIPDGFHIGDPIPGTGEDTDGDGKYDPPTKMSEFDLKAPLLRDYWEGNLPKTDSPISYCDICRGGIKIKQLDAAFYTNHTFAVLTDEDLIINGCLVVRNEATLYGKKHLTLNYDVRLLRLNNPHGLWLPTTWQPLKMVMWRCN